jgi:hypothetical protein
MKIAFSKLIRHFDVEIVGCLEVVSDLNYC